MTPEEQEQRDKLRDKGFVNGFESWQGTFFLVMGNVEMIERLGVSDKVSQTREEGGMFAINGLMVNLTNEFERLHKNTDWDELDWIDTVDEFVKEKLGVDKLR